VADVLDIRSGFDVLYAPRAPEVLGRLQAVLAQLSRRSGAPRCA
jgi:hypothetical protein